MRKAQIEHYSFGVITIGGAAYDSDVLVLNGRVKAGWRRREKHSLKICDFKAVKNCKPDFLVVGTGASGGMFVPGEIVTELEEAGICVVFAPTGEACEIFNEYLLRGEKTAGAFHLTC